jgi:hypothetical protein
MKRGRFPFIAILFIAIAGCGETGGVMVAGKVTIDGKPVDRGLITFQPVGSAGKPAGASVENGKFTIDKSQNLQPGDYQVTLQAQRRTGKTLQDRQMPTTVEEMAIVNLKKDTLSAHLSTENAQQQEFDFNEAR